MARRVDTINIYGFHAHESDFAVAFSRMSQMEQELMNSLPKIIYNVHLDPAGKSFCAFVILGQSDREDTPGLTSEQRRDSEKAASVARAQSFDGWLLKSVNDLFSATSQPGANAWQDLNRVFVYATGIGASQLIAEAPQNEEERRGNRRIELVVQTVDVGILTDEHPNMVDAS